MARLVRPNRVEVSVSLPAEVVALLDRVAAERKAARAAVIAGLVRAGWEVTTGGNLYRDAATE